MKAVADPKTMTPASCLALAFAFGAVLRLLPSLLAWPNPIGYDITTYYAPVAVYFNPASAEHWVGLFSEPNYSPLVYLAAYMLTRIAPVFVALDLLAVLFSGILGASIFKAVSAASEMKPSDALLAASFSMLQIPLLRIGWDLLKAELALALLLLLLATYMRAQTSRTTLPQVVLGLLLGFAHQLVAALGLLTLAVMATVRLTRTRRTPVGLLVSIGSVASVLLLSLWLGDGQAFFFKPPQASLIFLRFSAEGGAFPPYTPLYVNYLTVFRESYTALVRDWCNMLLFLFVPILPFLLLGLGRSKRFIPLLAAALPGTVGVVLWPSFAPWLWQRWMLLLAAASAIVAGIGLVRLVDVARKYRLQSPVAAGCFLLLGILALGFMLAPVERALPYFTQAGLAAFVPTTMQVSSIPLEDTADVVRVVQELNRVVDSSDVVVVHEALYGWVALHLTSRCTIVDYNLGTPGQALEYLSGKGYRNAYLIWWVRGFSWHGQTAPTNFQVILESGRIALYVYDLYSSSSSTTSAQVTCTKSG